MSDPKVSGGQAARSGEVREGQRIAKAMARAGLCSRRDAEAWIAAGRVSVNGVTLESPAYNVSEADDVRVDGVPLRAPERTRLFLFHKPRGLVTTDKDPEGRPTIFDALPPELPRLITIGRLDINTEGLLLLTNDGGLGRILELPATGWLRRYRVRVHGDVDLAALETLREGITIDGVAYAGIEAKLDREQGSNAWITMGLREGKNREIKKVLEHLGLMVNRLIRISFGPFELGDLPEGEVAEVRTRVLREQLGARLAKEAGANFDAPVEGVKAPEPAAGPPARAGRQDHTDHEERERRPPDRRERFDRGADAKRRRSGGVGAPRRFETDAGKPREPVKLSVPERKRKHVSALRAEIAGDVGGGRKRIVRSATKDRKGREVAVERRTPARAEAPAKRGPARPDSDQRKVGRRRPGAQPGEGRERSRDYGPRKFADRRPSRDRFGERDEGKRSAGDRETKTGANRAPREGGRESNFKPGAPRNGPPRGAPREAGREEKFRPREARRPAPRGGPGEQREDRRPERPARKGPPRERASGPPREDRRPDRPPRKGPPRDGAGGRRDDRRPERPARKGPPRERASGPRREDRRPEGSAHRGPPRGPRAGEPGRGPRRPPRKP